MPGRRNQNIYIYLVTEFLYNHAAQDKQCQGIWYYHQVVEHICQLPYQIIGQAGAQEYEDDGNQGEYLGSLCPKEIGYIYLGKEVPAENCGKGEEQQADGHEDAGNAMAKDSGKGQLCHIGLGYALGSTGCQNAAISVQARDNNQGSQG